jgi:glutathione S-transferase
MVTAETTNEVLFAKEGCLLSKFIELVTKFLPLPPKIIKLKKPNKEILAYSQTKAFPLLKAGDDFINGALPIIKYLIKSAKDISDGVVLDNRTILLGKNLKEEAKVDMWLNFIFSKIFPITVNLENQLYGKKRFDIRRFECDLNDLLEILVEINNYLEFNTFLTANHVQLGDIMLASALFTCYNDVFTQIELDMFPNVIGIFRFVSNMRYFKEVFRRAMQCKKLKSLNP